MNTLLTLFAVLFAWALAVWIIQILPLPGNNVDVPKRLAQAAVGICLLAWTVHHFHWLGL